MPSNPIGISFIPTEENQAMGPQRNSIEGAGGSDLAEAFKILSLRLPRVLGARAISSPRLLNSPGAEGLSGAAGGFNPYAAVFDALLQQMRGSGGGDVGSLESLLGGGNVNPPSAGGGYSAPTFNDPQIIPGDEEERRRRDPSAPTVAPPSIPSIPNLGRNSDPFYGDYLGGRHRF